MTERQIKQCQNCKNEFTIKPEDFLFYEKMEVPPPTFCPQCRLQRRFMFINERKLHKRKDSHSGKPILSIFSNDVPFPVYEQKYWHSDEWEATSYARDYDFSRPFFEQFKELSDAVPRYALTIINSVNCEYCTKIVNSKNCYLTVGYSAEDCMYGNINTRITKKCIDYFFLIGSENCYEAMYCTDCSNVYFSQYASNCRDSAFLYDCSNCANCFGCVGLRNKQYYIFNKPYSKEAYEKKMKELDMGSFKKLEKIKETFEQFKKQFPRRYAMLFNSLNTRGNDVTGAKNCHMCFDSDAKGGTIEDCKFLHSASSIKDSYDMMETGEGGQLCYEGVLAWGYRILFSFNIPGNSNDVQYSDTCFNVNNVFGCVGLKNKQYCILNKRYSREEYEKLLPQIIKHMNDMPYKDSRGNVYRYGEFFPVEFSPFPYNETLAQEYFPLTQKQAEGRGYRWRQEKRIKEQDTHTVEKLPDRINETKENILERPVGCMHEGKCNEQCTYAFKIIPTELAFYKGAAIALPRLCPNCRHYQRLKKHNPLNLWKRTCQCAGKTSNSQPTTNYQYKNVAEHSHKQNHCSNEFETTFTPEREEIIYCETCYQAEVL